jgi:hypothetical protein
LGWSSGDMNSETGGCGWWLCLGHTPSLRTDVSGRADYARYTSRGIRRLTQNWTLMQWIGLTGRTMTVIALTRKTISHIILGVGLEMGIEWSLAVRGC